MFDSVDELWKGLTDLPISVFSLILGILLQRNKNAKKEWCAVFYLVSFSALFGALVHSLAIPQPYLNILWIALYFLLYELLRTFTHCLLSYFSQTHEKEKFLVRLLEFVLYGLSVIFLFTIEIDIYMFVIFSVLLFVRVFVYLIRHPIKTPRVIALLILLIAAVIFQAFAAIIPYGVVFTHLMITIALFDVFLIAKEDIA